MTDATLKLVPYQDLGGSDYGWLNAHYHFSFARYWNPKRMGFGALRVINDDIVQAGRGFAPHDHDNMEIITFVRSGAITHRDSMGNEGRTEAGDVQVMSAGSGVTHSEYNLEDIPTTLYQIWIEPNVRDIPPDWDSRQFPKEFMEGQLPLLVSGQEEHRGQKALVIHQDAAIYGGQVKATKTVQQTIKHQAYLLVSKGEVEISTSGLTTSQIARQGDGMEITRTKSFQIHALSDAEILVIDVPA